MGIVSEYSFGSYCFDRKAVLKDVSIDVRSICSSRIVYRWKTGNSKSSLVSVQHLNLQMI